LKTEFWGGWRKEDGKGSVPADFEGGGGHGGEFGRYGEDAVEFAVGEGLGYFGGDTGEDSVWCEYIGEEYRGFLIYLVLPRRTSATPSSSPKVIWRSRKALRARPSMRMFCRRAWRTKARSLSEGSASRGILRF